MKGTHAKERLRKKARGLAIFTVAYNIVEGVLSIIAGAAAGSAALIGFGLDSFVESLSGGIMVWRFSERKAMTQEQEHKIEERAEKLVGWTFIILAAYVAFESAEKLLTRDMPGASVFGIVIALLSLIIMPILYYHKVKTGKALESRSLIADAKETLACMMLSAALLAGLLLNLLFGLWWADPAAGLVIAFYLVKEGREILSGGCGCGKDE